MLKHEIKESCESQNNGSWSELKVLSIEAIVIGAFAALEAEKGIKNDLRGNRIVGAVARA